MDPDPDEDESDDGISDTAETSSVTHFLSAPNISILLKMVCVKLVNVKFICFSIQYLALIVIIIFTVDCFNPSSCVSFKTSFTQHIYPALEHTGAYENRFGKLFLVF